MINSHAGFIRRLHTRSLPSRSHTKRNDTQTNHNHTFFLPNCCTSASLSVSITTGASSSASTAIVAGAVSAAPAAPASAGAPPPPWLCEVGVTHVGSATLTSSAEVAAAGGVAAAGAGGGTSALGAAAAASSVPALPSAALMAAAAALPPPVRLTHRFASGSWAALCFGFTGLFGAVCVRERKRASEHETGGEGDENTGELAQPSTALSAVLGSCRAVPYRVVLCRAGTHKTPVRAYAYETRGNENVKVSYTRGFKSHQLARERRRPCENTK